MNRLARLPWRLTARALGSSNVKQAAGASPVSWQIALQVRIMPGASQAAGHACMRISCLQANILQELHQAGLHLQ